MEQTVIQGLSTGEMVFAFFFIFCLFLGYGIYLRHQYILSLPIEPEPEPESVPIDHTYSFDYSIENLIGLYYKGEYVVYASFINDRVDYHWVDGNAKAMASHPAPINHNMTVESNLRKLAKGKFEARIPKTKVGDFEQPDYAKYKARQKEQNTKKGEINLVVE